VATQRTTVSIPRWRELLARVRYNNAQNDIKEAAIIGLFFASPQRLQPRRNNRNVSTRSVLCVYFSWHSWRDFLIFARNARKETQRSQRQEPVAFVA